MANTPQQTPFDFYDDDPVDIKAEVRRYVRYWPWFVVGLLITLSIAIFYLRYTPNVYQTQAKVKILDESEGLELPTTGFIFNRSNINLENEIEIMTSYLILEKVVKDLGLNTAFYEEGNIKTSQLAQLPIGYEQLIAADSVTTSETYKVSVEETGFEVEAIDTEEITNFANHNTYLSRHNLPFQLRLEASQKEVLIGKTFIISLQPIKKATLGLKRAIEVQTIGEQSDLLQLSIKGESRERSETILNKLIDIFNQDGIEDRQLVSKRTLEFIDERFVFLAEELDSIEVNKQEFKQENNLIYLEVDAQSGIEQRSQSDAEAFKIENQLALAKALQEALEKQDQTDLLPANIGLQDNGINALIQDYNTIVTNLNKITVNGGRNNPTVIALTDQLANVRRNITSSVNTYISQLELSKSQIRSRNQRFVGQVAQLPEKEKLLRAIERQQKIKESLYLLLLQKREEAAINLAITEPSIKVVEYALSGEEPIAPKSNIILMGGLLLGLLLPFGVLYLRFMLDTKVHQKEDITKVNSETPVIAEIPDMKKEGTKLFTNPNDRSMLAEAFRILAANVNYSLPLDEEALGKVIFCTSTIKGEGKTFTSLNLSLALSSMNKKVLLIGADLRNPQIHTIVKVDKDQVGLSNYLHDPTIDWKTCKTSLFKAHPNHQILFSGSIPPNPPSLLTNGRFEQLLDDAKTAFDYIIVDTAPSILVTDTTLIAPLADATLYMVRADVTEKSLLQFSKNLAETKKLNNMLYVLNGVGASKAYGYSYNYGYNYGYGHAK
ncbi:GumC family protein [Mangrovimonas cancribranchiae]|uniref:non-specific protein-tyrosine kinase n=1 Tax=Mangrovimonas cancribranchiae TaxID=3080055 RepID=A0AAU6P296_9FLAO